MNVERPADAATFLGHAGPLLLEHEARHNLLLGLAATIRDHPDVYPDHRLWIVRDGEIVGAALRTPPHKLVLARPRADRALDALVSALDEDLPGVVAAVPEVDAFVERWERRRPIEPRRVFSQGVFSLERVNPVAPAPGRAREATPVDRSGLLGWLAAFAIEALHDGGPDEEQTVQIVDRRIAAADAGFLLWEDGGEAVSLAGWGGPTPKGIRVGPVLHPARAARTRVCDGARRRALGAAPRGRPAVLLPLHRPRESDLEPDLRADRLRPCLRVGRGRVRREPPGREHAAKPTGVVRRGPPGERPGAAQSPAAGRERWEAGAERSLRSAPGGAHRRAAAPARSGRGSRRSGSGSRQQLTRPVAAGARPPVCSSISSAASTGCKSGMPVSFVGQKSFWSLIAAPMSPLILSLPVM